MPTLEERLQELERALSVMKSEHISDITQLGERVDILQRQITEQQRRISEQGQSLHQRFDILEKAISRQFGVVDQRFDTLEKNLSQQFATINQGFLQVGQRFLLLEEQGKQQTEELKAKFGASDQFAARTWGLAQEQERDIRTMKEDIRGVSGRLDNIDRRFDTQDEKLNLILERLPKQ